MDQCIETNLHYTTLSNYTEAVQLPLQHNPAIEAKARKNLTPLHYSAQYKNT